MAIEDELIGRVTSFDADSGLGDVEVDDHSFVFHCVSIAGGRRLVEIGAMVRIRVRLRLGRPEAVELIELV